VLLVQKGHLSGEEIGYVLRRVAGGTDVTGGGQQSSVYFQGRFELSGLGFAHAVDDSQFPEVGPGKAVQATVGCQKTRSQVNGVLRGGADPQQYGNEFRVA